MAGWEFLASFPDALGIRHKSESQKIDQRRKMDLLAKLGPTNKRLQLRSEQKRPVNGRVVKRFFSRAVARAKQFSFPRIPNRKREHPGQAFQTLFSPIAERFDQDLRI